MQQLQKLVVCLILVTLFTFSSFRPALASSNYPSSNEAAIETSTERAVTGSEAGLIAANGVGEPICKQHILTNIKGFYNKDKNAKSELLTIIKEYKEYKEKYKDNSPGFSGVYNIDTKEWMALPSLKEDEQKNLPKVCTVPRTGGHVVVQKQFMDKMENKDKKEKNVGFYLSLPAEGETFKDKTLKKDETFKIGFISGKINCCFNSRKNSKSEPSPDRQTIYRKFKDAEVEKLIKKVISETTGYGVVDDPKADAKIRECNSDDYELCPLLLQQS